MHTPVCMLIKTVIVNVEICIKHSVLEISSVTLKIDVTLSQPLYFQPIIRETVITEQTKGTESFDWTVGLNLLKVIARTGQINDRLNLLFNPRHFHEKNLRKHNHPLWKQMWEEIALDTFIPCYSSGGECRYHRSHAILLSYVRVLHVCCKCLPTN